MKMFTELFQLFKKPSAMSLVVTELDDAQCTLLAAETARDYANASVEYNRQRIDRLTRYVRTGQISGMRTGLARDDTADLPPLSPVVPVPTDIARIPRRVSRGVKGAAA